LAATLAETEPAEKRAEAELLYLSDEASSARLKAELAQRMRAIYEAEQHAMDEQQPAVKLHSAKAARAAETRALLKELRAQLEADATKMAALAAQETAIEQAEVAANAGVRQTLELYQQQLGAARRVSEQQQSFMQQKLREGREREAASPAEATLLDVTIDFVRTQYEASQQELHSLEAEVAVHEAARQAESGARQSELRAIRAERKAIRVANEHRSKFADEKSAQLEVEEREAAEAAKGLEGRATCVEMVRLERDAAREICEKLELAAEAAERARAEKRQAVEQLKAANQAKLMELNSQLVSEASVLAEQKRYAASLEERCREESLQCVPGAAQTAVRGLGIVDAHAGAAQTFVAELADRLKKCEAAHAEASREKSQHEKRGAAEAHRLAEQKEAMADALQKLAEYQKSLIANLASPPQHAAAQPPPHSVRRSHIVEVDAPPTAPGAPPAIPPELGSTLASLKSLRSSAEGAIEAARLIDRVSANSNNNRNSHAARGSLLAAPESSLMVAAETASAAETARTKRDGRRSASPVDVAKLEVGM